MQKVNTWENEKLFLSKFWREENGNLECEN